MHLPLSLEQTVLVLMFVFTVLSDCVRSHVSQAFFLYGRNKLLNLVMCFAHF
jgi:hypothetical protein